MILSDRQCGSDAVRHAIGKLFCQTGYREKILSDRLYGNDSVRQAIGNGSVRRGVGK